MISPAGAAFPTQATTVLKTVAKESFLRKAEFTAPHPLLKKVGENFEKQASIGPGSLCSVYRVWYRLPGLFGGYGHCAPTVRITAGRSDDFPRGRRVPHSGNNRSERLLPRNPS